VHRDKQATVLETPKLADRHHFKGLGPGHEAELVSASIVQLC